MTQRSAVASVEHVVEPDVVVRLSFAIGRLHRQLTHVPADLTFAQMSALSALEKFGPLRLRELAHVEHVTAPSMSRTLAGLIAAGLARKVPDPQDGRSCFADLAPAGVELVERVRGTWSRQLASRVDRLTPQQLDTLVRALPVLDRLTSDVDGEKPGEVRP